MKARPKDSDKNLLYFGAQTQEAHKKGGNRVIGLVFSNIFSFINSFSMSNVEMYAHTKEFLGLLELHICIFLTPAFQGSE